MLMKRGQQTMAMPFGMIFAIFLIVVFIVVAFIAIKFFIGLGESISVGSFYKEFQEAVDEAWRSQSSEFSFNINLPSEIEKVCFANLSASITGSQEDYSQIKNYEVYDANVFLIPPEYAEGNPWNFINHLNLKKIIEKENPYCVNASGELKIRKDFYDKLVVVG